MKTYIDRIQERVDMYRLKLLLAMILAVCHAAGSGGTRGQVGVLLEYQAKARYLGALAEFVTWPGRSAVPDKSKPFVLGVLGRSPFELHLNEEYSNKTIQGRRVRIDYYRSIGNIGNCDMLFICESESERLPEVLAALRGKPILTLGESWDFAKRGVMICLEVDQQKIRIDVNLRMVHAEGFAISSHVLKRARLVE